MSYSHPVSSTCDTDWSIQDAASLYRLTEWGQGHFAINEAGHLILCATDGHTPPVDLYDLVQQVSHHAPLPIMLRFPHLIEESLNRIYAAFHQAIDTVGYRNAYKGVYPLKVNHQHQVVDAMCRVGLPYGHGFEVGTKAELNIALAYAQPGTTIIINGYKDPALIRLALGASQLGVCPVLVIESLYEVPLLIAAAKESGVMPTLGIRVKLATKPSGHWQQTGGIRSVFGLNAIQINHVITLLQDANLLDALQLVHFHFGSQLPMLSDIESATTEACYFYTELVRAGVPLRMMDIGGGLAVDYIGHQTSHAMSKNYTLPDFATCMMGTIARVMDQHHIPHPLIISEFGRATVAASSALIFNVLDVNQHTPSDQPLIVTEAHHPLIHELQDIGQEVSDPLQAFERALAHRDEVYGCFRDGQATLDDRVMAESLVWQLARTIQQTHPDLPMALRKELADVYYGNFSIFQSLPDVWAIDQIFPILPIHRLNEAPRHHAIISDITCDCDGKIDQFVGQHGIESTIPLHAIQPDVPYVLGVFLIGAYQETLGDLHNLFGDPHVVSVDIHQPHATPTIIHGDTVRDVIQYCRYDTQDLFTRFNQLIRRALETHAVSPEKARHLMQLYAHTLVDSTYNRPPRTDP
ncbi:biosynthetic arginine decarboxylase [bacterium]|nr:biosynthetic arginine decarboxylase [bacterium]